MSRGKTNLFGRNGEREVVRVEKEGKVTYFSYLVFGNRRSPRRPFAWKGGEEDQVRQWLKGGPDPE
jgi:hypothetical protein